MMHCRARALQDEFPSAKYHLIGHSAGGQLIGLMPNYQALTSVVSVACSSGRIKNMDMPFKAQAILFMNGAITLGNLLLKPPLQINSIWEAITARSVASNGVTGVMAKAISRLPLAKRSSLTSMIAKPQQHYG